jgi:flagellar biogenesis protein FliO
METLAQGKTPLGKKLLGICACLLALGVAQALSSSGSPNAASSSSVAIHDAHAFSSGFRVVICALAMGGLGFWWWRQAQLVNAASRSAAALQIVGRADLGPKTGLALVEADGQRVLIAFGDGFAQVLSRKNSACSEEDES